MCVFSISKTASIFSRFESDGTLLEIFLFSECLFKKFFFLNLPRKTLEASRISSDILRSALLIDLLQADFSPVGTLFENNFLSKQKN